MVATIFGCSGFLGRYVAQALGRIGCQLVLPYRCDDLDVQHLRPMGDLGQVVMLPDFDPRDQAAYDRAVSRSNVVINLIGGEQETWNYGFQEVHVDVPRRIAEAVLKRGPGAVEHFYQFSSVAASADAPSRRLRTKAEGDAAVAEALGDLATFWKLAPVTGTEDRVFNQLAGLIKTMPAMPLVDGGSLRLQPVLVRDAAQAVFNGLQREDLGGRTVALAGPRVFTLRELADVAYNVIREEPNVLPVPEKIAALAAKPVDWLSTKTPFRPDAFFSADSVAELARGDFTLDAAAPVAGGELLTAQDLNVEPRSVIDGHPIEFLRYYRTGGYMMGSAMVPEGAESTRMSR